MGGIFLALLSAVFSPDIEQMGSEDFLLREAASKRASRFMPFNQYIVKKGLHSRDLEIRRRCKDVLSKQVDFATVNECWQAYCIAYHILYRDGSVYLSPGENVEVRRASPLLIDMFTLIAKRDNLLPTPQLWVVNASKQVHSDVERKVEYVSLLRKRAQKVQEPYGH